MVQLASGRKEAPKDKPSQYCSGQEGCCSREGRSCPGRNLGWCPDTSAWVTLGVLHSRHCACKTSAFLHWEMVRGEGIGWVSGCMWQWVCHPNTPSPPSSLPRDSPLRGKKLQGRASNATTMQFTSVTHPSSGGSSFLSCSYSVPQPCTCLGFSDLLQSTAHSKQGTCVSPGRQHWGVALPQSDGLCPWQSAPGLGVCG